MFKFTRIISALLALLLLVGGLGKMAEAAPPSKYLFLSEMLDEANAYSGCDDDKTKFYASEVTIANSVRTLITKAIKKQHLRAHPHHLPRRHRSQCR